ncbi:MAG: bifunctional riboflavin kinase/FAD synthetase [Anaerolineales bacterium]
MDQLASLHEAHLKQTYLSIGVFDGVHLGHQKMIREMSAAAHSEGRNSVVLTFSPHPAEVLRGPRNAFYLSDPQEKNQHIAALGVDVMIEQTFDQAMANTSARDFVLLLREHLDLRQLWVGHDFALGHNREGNVPALQTISKELGFSVHLVDPVDMDGAVISSSRIRKLLAEGNVLAAARLLGRPYSLSGEVISGAKRGRSIGIPTANMKISEKRVVPAIGVYVCWAYLDGKRWGAVTNIGMRPTFDDKLPAPVVEAHILDYDGEEFYGQTLGLDFVSHLRAEQRFNGVDQLLAQILRDTAEARTQLAALSVGWNNET